MLIRHAFLSDLDCIMDIYKYAREQMKKNGNPSQWGDSRPAKACIINDIRQKNSYVIEHEGVLCGIFTFIIGDDPSYEVITDGRWLNEEPYGVIHRAAGNGNASGIMDMCLTFCEKQIHNIRIDTHRDNKIMQHILEKRGYQKCGTIFVEDGTPRIAYQKKISNSYSSACNGN